MIIVFPMLTDESVSQNILPGICKALEKFILVYELDAVMKLTGTKILSIGGKVAAAAATTMIGKTKSESENLLEDRPIRPDKPLKAKPGETSDETWKRTMDEYTDEVDKFHAGDGRKGKDAAKKALDTLNDIRRIGTVDVDMPRDSAISVEPTYMMVTTTTGTKVIGVKVIPFPVKTKEGYSLAELLTADASLKFMDTMVYKIQRKAIRAFWALCRGIRVPFIRDRVITGDPEKDILWASTFHKRFVYCLLNYSDINSEFFKNAGGIHKLHGIGWNSFILADDVNKRAVFCMKEFHGLCSTTPYSFIYGSLGKDASKIYSGLEDIKKAASPFFKTSINSKKIFGEAINAVSSYLKRLT